MNNKVTKKLPPSSYFNLVWDLWNFELKKVQSKNPGPL
jgi:hypothetical protein